MADQSPMSDESPEHCPEREFHGRPFRYCPSCSWVDEPTPAERTQAVLHEVGVERLRQVVKHGDQSHLPDGTGGLAGRHWIKHSPFARAGYAEISRVARAATNAASQSQGDGSITYADILLEETFEALAENDPAKLRAELVQVAAVAVQWIETIDRRGSAS